MKSLWLVAFVAGSLAFSVSAASPPTISAQTFTIPENPVPGATIGTVVASDPDGGALTYAIVDHSADTSDPRQNPSGIFVLNATSGVLTVKSTLTQAEINAILDYDLKRSPQTAGKLPYVIDVKVTKTGGLSKSADISIDLTDINEPFVVTDPGTVTRPEHFTGVIATISAADPESIDGSKLTFSLVSGYKVGADPVFAINPTSGEVSVVNAALLDYESTAPNHQFVITVHVHDDASPTPHSADVVLTIRLENVQPTILTKKLDVKANAPGDSAVGILEVSNPDGGTVSFTVVSFTIDGQTIASPTTLFAVDADGTLILKKDSVTVFAAAGSKQTPDATLRVRITGSVGSPPDFSDNDIKLNRQSLPGGSPLMLSVNEQVGNISGINGTRGEPIQDIANGPNGEIIAVGSINGAGFLTIQPASFSAPINVTFPAEFAEFTPVSVVTDSDSIYVGGMLGANLLNEWAYLLDGSLNVITGEAVEPPLQRPAKESLIFKYSLQGELLRSVKLVEGRDAIIMDMTVADGNVFVCGGARDLLVDNYPLTYEPFWAKYDANLTVKTFKRTHPNKPGNQFFDGVGWHDFFALHSAIAVSPAGDVYVGGYTLEWGDRHNPESADATGYLARFKLQPDGSYGDAGDPKGEQGISKNETWIGDRGENGESRIFSAPGDPYREIRPWNFTFIKDLAFVTSGGQATLYALEEFRYRGLPFKGMVYRGTEQQSGDGYQNEYQTPNADNQYGVSLKIARFTPDLFSDTGTPSAYIHPETYKAATIKDNVLVPHDVRAGSMAVDPDGNIYVTGIIPAELTTKLGTNTLIPAKDKFFVTKYTPDLQLSWVESLDDGAYQPLIAPGVNYEVRQDHSERIPMNGMGMPGAPLLTPFLAEWSNERNALLLGGNFRGGEVIITRGEGTASAQVNSVAASSPTAETGFLTFITSGKEFVGSSGVVIESIVETDGRTVGSQALIHPFLGAKIARVGQIITVEAPRTMYAKRNYTGGAFSETYLGTFNTPPTEDEIRNVADTRYILTGITVGNREFHADVTSYTFTFDKDITLTLHWKAEHAVTIENDLSGTEAVFDAVTKAWKVGASGIGLTTTAGGNPDPPVDKNWVAENGIETAFINGTELDSSLFGTRYITTGYEARGSARDDLGSQDLAVAPEQVTFNRVESRHQVTGFVVKGPARITYKWGVQHRVQVSTSSSRSQNLPGVKVEDASGQANNLGVGEFWYNRGTKLKVGARDDSAISQQLRGWLNVSGIAGVPDTSTDDRTSLVPFTIAPNSYLGFDVPSLQKPIVIAWNYGDTIYTQTVTIGAAVPLSFAGFPEAKIKTPLNQFRQPDRVRLVDGPPGSAGPDMQEWDDVARKPYPVRPGIFFLEWDQASSDAKIILEVTSGFGGDPIPKSSPTATFAPPKRHYRHLAHPDMPAVALDADAKDGTAFLRLAYTESDAAITAKAFTAQRPGRHVLLFSQSAAGVAANGDRTIETLLVRVVETRRWDTVYDATSNPDKVTPGAWTDAVGSAMLQTPSAPVTIGQRLASALDTAAIGTAFVVSPLARYNVNLYDRTKVADAGPIFPVNRHFTGKTDDDLIVVWYEHAEVPATIPSNILWPYQSVKYNTAWPTGGSQPVDRIVVASRLGSEGRNENDVNQSFFDREKYDRVRIYEQADRTKPGYNPNEEHALIAPSFKFLDQANPPPAAFALRNDLNVTASDATYTSDPFVLVEYFDRKAGTAGEYKMGVYRVELEDDRPSLNPYRYPEVDPDPTNPNDQREFPYTFHYKMKAGEVVQPPYPLGLVIGLTPCRETHGTNDSISRVYWEDIHGQPWAVSAGGLLSYPYYPQAVNFWNGEGTAAVAPGSCIKFPTAGAVFVTGTAANPVFASTDQFIINSSPVTIGASSASAFVSAVNALVGSDVQAVQLSGGEVRLRSKTGSIFTLVDGTGSPLAKAGIAAKTYRPTDGVSYTAEWPDTLPILKVGETLTFSGGEFKADNPGPEQPGLPGVIGWAAGKIVFDSKNPTMSNLGAFDFYAGRLIAPLEERFVQLTDADGQALETIIQPANGLTKVVGTLWKFTGLPSSLGKRIFYDPIKNRLGIKGYLNDRTLGDGDLTATPPPVYVLEPDILTGRERDTLLVLKGLKGTPQWTSAVNKLYTLSRNPDNLAKATPDVNPYYAGLENDVEQENNGDKLDASEKPILIPNRARHKSSLGPGLALVASPQMLEPGDPNQVNYLTLAENDDGRVGGPVALHIVKIEKKHRYRGAIKTILSDNVFDERITLRHTADFGGNGDDIVYQWFYREEDGHGAPLPPDPVWRLFIDQSENLPKGLGLYQITLEGTGGLILADNLFFLRYRHKNDAPTDGANSANWAKGSVAKPYGTEWNRDGADYIDPEARDILGNPDTGLKFGGEWAGAANSPSVDKVYRAQLVMGWIKRVLDRVNPYEARFSDFRNNDAPATYANMILEAGQRPEGPVALNPDKNVIENVGLIELYQTILDRGISLSIGLSSPITTPGINNALLLAATRISDLYMLLGNEAYTDALDPTIGYVSGTGLDLSGANPGYGSMAPAVFAFQNQVSSLLEEELALLRGIDDSYGRPVYNRLFWNFTKGEGEAAYAMNYNIKDINQDGFIDENDARILYPQGHGDAWGHYLTALKTRYALLKHPYFNWQTRSEFYNLLDVVIPVDYLDERKFAEVAAAKAQAGTEIVNMTYRSQYVDDPAGQWQGYTDPVPGREWGVTEWARRAGQGALFDWVTANALIPSREADPTKQGLQRIDRTTVKDLGKISANLGSVQSTYDNANSGLNPLGLDNDVMPFDLDPLFPDIGSTAAIGRVPIQGTSHFEQIYERAFAALNNARVAFDYATVRKNALRQVADNIDQFRQDVIEKDRDYRNRLIEIFGTPYEGVIGTGKPYPAGYAGPDLSLFMYVDVREVSASTVPPPSAEYAARLAAFGNDLKGITGEFKPVLDSNFLSNFDQNMVSWTGVVASDNSVLDLKLPATAGTYTFQAPPEWGTRAAPGRLQDLISEMVQTEADVAYAAENYSTLILKIENQAQRIEAKLGLAGTVLRVKRGQLDEFISLNAAISTLKVVSAAIRDVADSVKDLSDATHEGFPRVTGIFDNDLTSAGRAVVLLSNWALQIPFRLVAFAADHAADILELSKETTALGNEIEIDKAGFSEAIQNQLKDLEELLVNEGATRIAAFKLKEQLRNQADQYRAALQEGIRLIQERETFNKNTAAAVQSSRYKDMAFRVSRNDGLQKYRAAFDLAARYTYMAAKAYDFETNLSPNDRGSAYGYFDQIIRARTLGEMADGIPLHPGGGLAGIAAMMMDNFRVMESQISLNNYQIEFNTFSLRQENFGIGRLPSDADLWKNQLLRYRFDNLWDSPEFRRYCRPFAPHDPTVAEPGLIIPFSTQVAAGKNFFGKPLQAGQSAYDPSNFATKIRSTTVQFENYDIGTLTKTPRIYLVPVGMDVMFIPTSRNLETRIWNVVDQKIPPPFKTSAADLADPNYIPVVDSLDGTLGEIRRYSSFLAYPGATDTSGVWKDMRLVGRSVWNTQWLMIIPGRALLSDPVAGLSTFVNGVTDITITLETYGSSGN